ncbi:DUF3040 domain-containing protein [Xanthomonas maliensis]|uniref:DUF3040 domain-containing protein n=1 Tax=Xanthomonas maliensis TaxID=1321368 RepID=UPI0003A3EA47|nr:DUF3040 domain-containing protein [Xanthomonas maliensis]KAB7766798.1 DUF3040 domain-containing protein [Xanthomonas maliensis]
MDDLQADAIARAILQPDPRLQEALRRKRAAEQRRRADGRLVAGMALLAMAIGALVAQWNGAGIAVGVMWGAVIGGLIGRAMASWRRRVASATVSPAD